MTKRITWLLLLVLGVGLGFAVPSAWASERAGESPSGWNAQDAGQIDVKILHTGANAVSASVVLYDQDWKAVSEVQPQGGRVKFDQLKVGDYHVMAYTDEAEDVLTQDVPVFARRTTTLEVQLNRPVATQASWYGKKYSACGSVATGEGGQLKVWAPYDQVVLYYQCGRIVGKVGQSGCPSCGRSGSWRYTSTCTKSSPIIVNLPCPRAKGSHK